MKQFSTNVQSILDNDVIDYFFLVNLYNQHYFCSLPFDVRVGDITYQAHGTIVEVDSPRFSSVVDRESYRIVLAESIEELTVDIKNNIIGKDIQIFIGFLNNGIPLTAEEDIISVYKGYVDRPSISNNLEQRLVNIEGTSPMSDLDAVNVFYASKDGMSKVDSDYQNTNLRDTAFDEIYGDREITIKWGKI
jgi:hypothetical protein